MEHTLLSIFSLLHSLITIMLLNPCCIFSQALQSSQSEDLILKNYSLSSSSANLESAFTSLLKSGNFSSVEKFILKLKESKINFIEHFAEAKNKYLFNLNKVYDKLKYYDQKKIYRMSPAFEWSENRYDINLIIKHSAYLNSLACVHVDDEKMTIRKNQKNVHYEAKCILNNEYIHFELELKLYAEVREVLKPTVERGQTSFRIVKKVMDIWDRLIEPGNKMPENSFRLF